MPPFLSSSASQIGTFNECEQHWYNIHVLKMPVEQSPTAFAGEVLHKQAEDYTTKGTEPTHPSVKLALQYLAPPKTPGVFAEFWLDAPKLYIKLADGTLIKMNGKVDYRDERNPKLPKVYDFKSKEKLDRYLKTPRTLTKDVQVNVYGAWALEKYKEAEAVEFAHIYLIRPEELADVKFVGVEVPREQILENVQAFIVPPLERMKEVADGRTPPEKNYNKCSRWFGRECPFYANCHTATSDRLASMSFTAPATEGEVTVSLMDKLRATKDAEPTIPLPEAFVGAAAPESATPAPEAGNTSSTGAGFELYIDTVPTKGVTTYLRLEEEIHRRSEIICKAVGAKSLHEKPLDFGKGRDKLADSFRTEPPTGVVLATTGGLSTAVIEVLSGLPTARKVFRGTK